MNVYVFKTSISQKDIRMVNRTLRTLITTGRWNFDLEDVDNILRIESLDNIAESVCYHLGMDGFYCEELE